MPLPAILYIFRSLACFNSRLSTYVLPPYFHLLEYVKHNFPIVNYRQNMFLTFFLLSVLLLLYMNKYNIIVNIFFNNLFQGATSLSWASWTRSYTPWCTRTIYWLRWDPASGLTCGGRNTSPSCNWLSSLLSSSTLPRQVRDQVNLPWTVLFTSLIYPKKM